MAGKKVETIEDVLKTFKDVVNRMKLGKFAAKFVSTDSKEDKDYTFLYSNRVMICQHAGSTQYVDRDGNLIFIIPDQSLWNAIIDDPELRNDMLESLGKTYYTDKFKYGENIENEVWFPLNADELYIGKILNIAVEGLEYEIPLNKSLIPLKLKKNEVNNIYYRVICTNELRQLIIRKEFVTEVTDANFSILSVYYII